MASTAKPLPSPRGIPNSQRMELSLVSSQQMGSEESDGRPKPPIRPKPKVLPKPMVRSATVDAKVVSPSFSPLSPKSPISEVPSAEKVNLLTGPKPYGATGVGVRRTSFTLKRQTSETLPADEACSTTMAPVSQSPAPQPPSLSPSVGAPHQDTPGEVGQTEVDSGSRDPSCRDSPGVSPDGKDARPPVLKKPAVSFRVKPVPGSLKPTRFPGTTVEQILAKMEEDKSTASTAGFERGWAQRSSISFDGGSRFGSTAYSSFRRSPSTSEEPKEDEEHGTPKAAGVPVSPIFRWTASALQQSCSPLQKSPEVRTDSAFTVTDHLKTTISSTVTPAASDVHVPVTSGLWNQTPEKTSAALPSPQGALNSVLPIKASEGTPPSQPTLSAPQNKGLEHVPGAWSSAPLSLVESELIAKLPIHVAAPELAEPPASKEPSSVCLEKDLPASLPQDGGPPVPAARIPEFKEPSTLHLENELTSSLLLEGVPLGPTDSPVCEEPARASIESGVSSSLPLLGPPLGPAESLVSSSTRVESEFVSGKTLGEVHFDLSASETPALKIVSPREPEAVGESSPPEVSQAPGSNSYLVEGSCKKGLGDTPAILERSLGGYEWCLSESFEWHSPSRSSELEMRRANLSATSNHEETGAQYPYHNGGTMPDSHVDNRSPELATVKGVAEMDQTATCVTTLSDSFHMSGPKSRLQEPPSDNTDDDDNSSCEIIEYPKWERRKYSGEQEEQPVQGDLVGEGDGMEKWQESDEPLGRASGVVEEVGLYLEAGTAEVFSEKPQEEVSVEGSRMDVFQAEEVFEPHTATTKVHQVESEPGLVHSAGLADARGLMEPLRPILLSDPAAEPCILYHGLAPVEHAMPSHEDDSCLTMLQASGGQPQEGPHIGNEGGDLPVGLDVPETEEALASRTIQGQTLEVCYFGSMQGDQVGEEAVGSTVPSLHTEHHLGNEGGELRLGLGAPEGDESQAFRTVQRQTFEVSDFDPIQSGQGAEKALEAQGPNSQWLEMMSPTPASEDKEQEHKETPQSKDPEHGLFGWSQKDLQSEFGNGTAEQTSPGKSVWDDQYGLGGTNQSREMDLENSDWSKKHPTGESDWGRESETKNTDWSKKHNIGEMSQREERVMVHNDWSLKNSMGDGDQSEESLIHHTDRSMQQRSLDDAYNINVMDQLDDGGANINGTDRLRESGDGESERREGFGVGDSEREREMSDGEMDRTLDNNVGVGERMLDIADGEMCRANTPGGESSELQHAQSTQDSEDLSVRSPRADLQPEMPPCTRLDESLESEASQQSPQKERPASLQSSHSQESEGKPMDYEPESLAEGDSPVKPVEGGSPVQSQPDLETQETQGDEAEDVDRTMVAEEEGKTTEGMEGAETPVVDFSFLEAADVLDCSVNRTRASLSRKRGHRPPTAGPGAVLNTTECDGDDWMFQDSTEPKVPRPDSSDEEAEVTADVAAHAEEQPQQSAKKSPVSQGKKLGIFAGFNPTALKAKLKSRKSAEEGEQTKPSRPKDNIFQRSKSCKLPAESGKPLVLSPKPEKAAGSESSSPQWLSALKLKKKSK